MSRTREVQSILANRRKLAQKPSVSIKPDMSFEERAVEKILLKKRWELIRKRIYMYIHMQSKWRSQQTLQLI